MTIRDIQELFTHEDADGNRLLCDVNLNLYLNLKNEVRTRQIGRIYTLPDGKLYYEKREDEKHIFRKNNSWSIHYEILKRVDYVKYMTRKCKYWIKSVDAMNKGEFLHFKASGIEKKIYVPLEHWYEQEYSIRLGSNLKNRRA